MNEEITISLAKDGHENAFRRLYEDHREMVYRLAYRYTKTQQDAEDIMQETFIKAFKKIKDFSYQNCASFSTWLGRICINCSIDYLRKCKRRKMDQMISLTEMPMEPESNSSSPDEAVHAEQIHHLIQKSIQALSPKQRIIFDLRYSQHRNIKEIAEYMNSSESSIKTHLFRLVSRLREQLGAVLEEQ